MKEELKEGLKEELSKIKKRVVGIKVGDRESIKNMEEMEKSFEFQNANITESEENQQGELEKVKLKWRAK